jgi:hypothetical protein
MSHGKVLELVTDIKNEFGKVFPAVPVKAYLESKLAELKAAIAKIEEPLPRSVPRRVAVSNEAPAGATMTTGLATPESAPQSASTPSNASETNASSASPIA